MKYNIIKITISILLGCVMFTSCGDDFLTNSSTDRQESGQPATERAILTNLAATYQILLFDSYADNNYNAVLLMSDLRSDDIFKGGGDAGDQATLYKLSQFQSSATETIKGLWAIYYSGLARSNNLLQACDNAVNVPSENLKKYKAEGHFLRAYYMHLLWKFYGDVVYFDKPLTAPYFAKQYSADEIYKVIMDDIDQSLAEDGLDMKTTGHEKLQGRASKAAILMLKARVVMYQKDQSRYAEVTKDMASIIKSGEYSLFDNFDAMWEDANEFCSESIFESNQLPEGKTWSTGWNGYGTNLPAFISPNDLKDPSKKFKGGWGFAPVRQEAYDMYELGDKRRDASINVWENGTYASRFQDTGLFQRKYAAREGYNPSPGDVDLNFSNNLRLFRYAETLLNYVELVKMHGQAEVDGISAQNSFDHIRQRAFGRSNPLAATADNIKLERRREFLGEGMRFWDLVRWGDAETVLTEKLPNFSSNRSFKNWMKHLPIPQSEIEKTKGSDFPLKQPGNWN